MGTKEREVFTMAFLTMALGKHRRHHHHPLLPVNALLREHSTEVFGELIKRMSYHVAKMGVDAKHAQPIPLTLIASIPVGLSFRHQVGFRSQSPSIVCRFMEAI